MIFSQTSNEPVYVLGRRVGATYGRGEPTIYTNELWVGPHDTVYHDKEEAWKAVCSIDPEDIHGTHIFEIALPT